MMFDRVAQPIDVLSILHVIPGCYLILLPDSPRFTIAGATDTYLEATYLKREETIGQGVFETLTDDLTNTEATGVKNLSASLNYVLEHKEGHRMANQRYDILNPTTGQFELRVWSPFNKPVLNEKGEVQYIIHTVEDITEKLSLQEAQKAAQQKLAESEANLRNMILQAPVAMCILTGPTFIVDIANERMFEIWGRGPKELLKKPMFEGLPEASMQGLEQLLQNVYATGERFCANERPLTLPRNGKIETAYLNFVYEPFRGTDGSITGVMMVAIDVTEQVVARMKVEESEARFRKMAENTPVLVAITDETSNAIYFNKAWTDVTGRPMEALLEYGWLDLLHPDDKESFLKIYQDAFAFKQAFTGEFRVLNPKGEFRWLLAHGVARFNTDGVFVGFISACTDITEHKNIQQQLQTALEQVRLSKEAAELGTFDMDLDKGTMHWDNRCRTLFGISHTEPVSYEKDFIERLHPDDKERVKEVIRESFDKSLSNGDYDVEYRTIGADDNIIRWVRAKGKVYFNRQLKPVRFIGSVLDITAQVMAIQRIEQQVEERTKELAKANERLKVYNQELQRSNKNLEEFAHAASHDMKEPIRKVLTFADRLKTSLSSRMSEGEMQVFQRMEASTQRMGLLVDDLLEFSQVSERPLEKEVVNLKAKLEKVLADLELQIEEKGATIKVGDLPVVRGYKRQLQQLLQNLVGNALKYSKPNLAPEITISSRIVNGKEVIETVLPEQVDKQFYLVEVSDNGIGFEQEYAERIFGMFQRLHGKAEYPGTGVGLSIARKVVENHNGYIWAESVPGEGATFKVLLPVE